MASRLDDSTVRMKYENIEIHSKDLECLDGGQYLNDTIINFYLKYMYRSLLNNKQQQQVHVFDSFFSEALDHIDRERTLRWLRRINIFEKDYLLIPAIIDRHWFLMIVCFPNNVVGDFLPERRTRILKMDSMSHHAEDKKPQLVQYLKDFIRTAYIHQRMSRLVIDEHIRRIRTVDIAVRQQVFARFRKTFVIYLAFILLLFKQTNQFDCGVCLLENAENFLVDTFQLSKTINPEVEFRLSGSRRKRTELRKWINKLIDASSLEELMAPVEIS